MRPFYLSRMRRALRFNNFKCSRSSREYNTTKSFGGGKGSARGGKGSSSGGKGSGGKGGRGGKGSSLTRAARVVHANAAAPAPYKPAPGPLLRPTESPWVWASTAVDASEELPVAGVHVASPRIQIRWAARSARTPSSS